jgi:hypothetical protein
MNTFCELAVRSFPWIACAMLVGGCDATKQTKEEKPREAPSATLPAPKAIPPSSQSSSKPIDTEPSCTAICEKAKAKACTSDLSICMAKCRDMTLEPECRNELAQALACLAGLADVDFQCGEEGFPEVLPGRCDREQQAVVQCLTAALK